MNKSTRSWCLSILVTALCAIGWSVAAVQPASAQDITIEGTPNSISMTFNHEIGDIVKLKIKTEDGLAPTFAGLELQQEWADYTSLKYKITDLNAKVEGPITKFMTLSGAQLSAINTTKAPKLIELSVSNNYLTELDLTQNTALTTLDCSVNKLQTLDLSHNTNLVTAYINQNKIDRAAMSQIIAGLTDRTGLAYGGAIYVLSSTAPDEENHCAKVDVQVAKSKNWAVWDNRNGFLDWELMPIPYEGEGTDANLMTLGTSLAAGTEISLTIEATGEVSATGLEGTITPGQENKLKLTASSIAISGDVTALTIHNAGITKIIADGHTTLAKLDCSQNNISKLSLFNCSALTQLNCSHNSLPDLSLRGCGKLLELNADNNKLGMLSVEECYPLERLYCANNFLKTLDLSGNKNISEVKCQNNQILEMPMAQLMKSLPNYAGMGGTHTIWVYDYTAAELGTEQNQCLTSHIETAQLKGWKVMALFEDGTEGEYEGMDVTFAVTLETNDLGQIGVQETEIDLNKVPKGTTLHIIANPLKPNYILEKLTANDVDILESKEATITQNTRIVAVFKNPESLQEVQVATVLVYPNPATDYLQLAGLQAADVVALLAADGTTLFQTSAQDGGNLTVDLTSFPAGNYFISINGSLQPVVIK